MRLLAGALEIKAGQFLSGFGRGSPFAQSYRGAAKASTCQARAQDAGKGTRDIDQQIELRCAVLEIFA